MFCLKACFGFGDVGLLFEEDCVFRFEFSFLQNTNVRELSPAKCHKLSLQVLVQITLDASFFSGYKVHIHLSGAVNKQKSHYWAANNPKIILLNYLFGVPYLNLA